MESPHGLLLVVLIATSAIIHLVQAEDPEGFISLDCGLPPNEVSPYIYAVNGLTYSSDSDFIQSGKIGRIEKKLEESFRKLVWTLRYFPDGTRNCYTLNVKQGTKYLIKVRFVYGNYDGLNNKPNFDLHIGPNFWVSMDLEKWPGGSALEEIIHTPRSNLLDVCLVKTGSSTPFISTLELRPLPNNTYITTSGSLRYWTQSYLSESKSYIRYPEDAYDRLWIPNFDPTWKQISTDFKANITASAFNLPQAVVTTAAAPANASEPLTYTDYVPFPNDKIFFFLHISEVQVLGDNETREFDIFWNEKVISKSYKPEYLQPKTVYNRYPVTCENGKCLLELKKTQNSTLPPLLNAIEMFIIIDTPQSETNENDVLTIRNIKATYELKRITWQGDPCAPQPFMWDGLICNIVDTSSPPRITSLNLSSSGLTGTIADGIQNLTYLEQLDLSNNSLTGVVPEFLANMKFLSLLNLSKNNLNFSIPQALRDREEKGLKIIVDEADENDEKPCLSGSCKKKFPVLIIVVVVASVIVVIVVVLVLVFVFKRKNASYNVKDLPSSSNAPCENVTSTGTSNTPIETKQRRFSYSEVMQMTKNLQTPLGEGGFGVVYHGDLNGSQQVAVKLLSQSSAQGYKEFKAEVELLLRVHHINLVSLVGYCDEQDHLALIYEYMSNVDLKHHLSGKHGSVLSWSTRLRIAIDSALGLEYLHNGCRPPMVHRDVKCTNILLDDHFTAKIADFGLSRSFQIGEESHVSTVVAGTPGYLDPEYYKAGLLAETSDVYSFGIVLLEIITNQRVIDQTRKKSHITEWTAFMLNRGDITRIMDPNLNGDYNAPSVWRALELAMSCANPSSEKRPNMSQVVIELKECLTSENLMRSKNQEKDSQGSLELSMSFDTKTVPSAR